MNWSVTTGLLSKVTTENGLGDSTMAYTTAVVPGGLWQKDRREVGQFLCVKDTSLVYDIYVQAGLLM